MTDVVNTFTMHIDTQPQSMNIDTRPQPMDIDTHHQSMDFEYTNMSNQSTNVMNIIASDISAAHTLCSFRYQNNDQISDEELIKLIFDDPEEPAPEDYYTPDELCSNPLCDHEEAPPNAPPVQPPNITIQTIEDLINLGKTYHCKQNKTYYGINLRILCNLVTPLTELNNLIGMHKVKENILNQIVFFLQGFNQSERCNNCIDCCYDLPCAQNANGEMLHTVITGPPGVGKTELGKILGHVYKAMGVLSQGHMHIATRSDLVGKYLGHTAAKTQEFIDKCKGGVMFIDEAYSLGSKTGRDSFSKECIDTINQNLTERRDFLCIIAGYKDSLEECFFAQNEGLKRRFTFRYEIDGYTSDELMAIFVLKVRRTGWSFAFDPHNDDTEETLNVKLHKTIILQKFFHNNINHFKHFGGDIETLLLNCKIHHGRRVMFDPTQRKILSLDDINNGLQTFVANRKTGPDPYEIPDSVKHMYM